MKILELPVEIQEHIKKYAKTLDPSDPLSVCFIWDETPEGRKFWENINDGHFEVFYKKYPKQEKSSFMYKVTRKQLKQIHDVACEKWKTRIISYVNLYVTPFNDEGELPKHIVKEMFDASNDNQKTILSRIFPEYSENENAFVREFSSIHLRKLSQELFGNEYVFQIGYGCCPSNRRDLEGKSFYFNNKYEVKLHEAIEGTIIEIVKK